MNLTLRKYNIDVISLCPGFVSTNLIGNLEGKTIIKTTDLVKESLKDIC